MSKIKIIGEPLKNIPWQEKPSGSENYETVGFVPNGET